MFFQNKRMLQRTASLWKQRVQQKEESEQRKKDFAEKINYSLNGKIDNGSVNLLNDLSLEELLPLANNVLSDAIIDIRMETLFLKDDDEFIHADKIFIGHLSDSIHNLPGYIRTQDMNYEKWLGNISQI